jgi:hypothetical protein
VSDILTPQLALPNFAHHIGIFEDSYIRDSGILGYWDIGILGYWDVGILGYWDIGILGCWDIGMLGY